jgi:hypothetical protein
MILNSPYISGSSTITGNLTVLGSISGSTNSAISASYALNATTSSYADTFTVAGTLTAQKLVVQTITSSIVYSSGSNVFGNSVSNTQSMTGSVGITGSLSVNGSLSGTSATFSDYIRFSANQKGIIGRNAANNGDVTMVQVSNTDKVNVDPSGFGTVLGGALSGTSATFTSENFLNTSGHTTNRAYARMANTGNTSYFGIESSTGGSIITGTNAYATIVGNGSARDLQFATNDAVRLTIASTGAATFSAGVGINGATLQTGLGAGLTIEGATYAPLYFSNSGTLRGYLTAYSGGLILASSTAPLTLNNTAYNVLIGTTTDSGYKLDVVGTFRATGAATFSTILNTSGRVSNAHTLGNMQEWVGNFSVNNGASISLFNINNTYDIISGDINMFIDLGGFYGYSTRFLMGYTVSSSLTLDSTISGIGGVSFTAGGTLYNETMTFTNNTGTNGNFRICIRVWGYGVNTSVATGGADLMTSSYLTRIK